MAAEGWVVTTLGNCLREPIRNGYSPVCPNYPTGKWILHLGAVTELGFNSSAVKPAPVDDPRVDAALLDSGDIVVSRSNTRERVGFAGLYLGAPTPCAYPDLLMRVRPNDLVEPRFLEQALLSKAGRKYFQNSARGTSGSMVKIDKAILQAFPLILPPRPEQVKISEILASVDDNIKKEKLYLDSLRGLKFSLSDALLSGQIRVTPDEVL